jgi:hypothetical protein
MNLWSQDDSQVRIGAVGGITYMLTIDKQKNIKVNSARRRGRYPPCHLAAVLISERVQKKLS